MHCAKRTTAMYKNIIKATLALLFAIGSTGQALAAPNWAINGSSCVPSGLTIQNDTFFVWGGRIAFNNPRTGTITMTCAVPVGVGSISSLRVLYRDSTGVTTSARLDAALRRIHKPSGAISSVAGLEFNSDNVGTGSYTDQRVFTNHTLDDDFYLYFVQMNMVRNDASQIVEFIGVELD